MKHEHIFRLAYKGTVNGETISYYMCTKKECDAKEERKDDAVFWEKTWGTKTGKYTT